MIVPPLAIFHNIKLLLKLEEYLQKKKITTETNLQRAKLSRDLEIHIGDIIRCSKPNNLYYSM